MESIVAPGRWADWPDENMRGIFQGFRSSAGESMILDENLFVEAVLPGAVLRELSAEEMAVYREPYLEPGEGRRPTLSWPRQLPIDGEPDNIVKMVDNYGRWLAGSEIPKLFINADPGAILADRQREICRAWPNQTEVTVPGLHFVQEDSPTAIGTALADFIRSIRP
jgi:haloalkane dehalogenase